MAKIGLKSLPEVQSRVIFDEVIQVIEIRSDAVEEDDDDASSSKWYTDNEYFFIRRQATNMSKQMNNMLTHGGGNNSSDTCFRGLEMVERNCVQRRNETIKNLVKVVMEKQQASDPEEIAAISMKISSNCRQKSVENGIRDAQEVKDYLSVDRKKWKSNRREFSVLRLMFTRAY